MSETLRINDVMTICDVSKSAVIGWIKKGYLPAEQADPGKYRSAYIIKEDDLKAFMTSDNYTGHPEDIAKTRIFNRTPVLEECYPINLLIAVRGVRIDAEDGLPMDIWEYDIRQFRYLISLLNDREQRVLQMRYQLGMTLDEVGAALGPHRERIRQIQKKAERKLRHWMASKGCRVVSRDAYNELEEEHNKLKAQYSMLEHELMTCKTKLNDIQEEQATVPEAVNDLYKVKLEDLDLSVRSYNCLKRAMFNTLGDMIFFDQHQGEVTEFRCNSWYSIRNLGRRSLLEVARRVFDYCGYRLRDWRGEKEGFVGLLPICEDEMRVPGGVEYER